MTVTPQQRLELIDRARRHTWKATTLGPGRCRCGHRHDERDHPAHLIDALLAPLTDSQ